MKSKSSLTTKCQELISKFYFHCTHHITLMFVLIRVVWEATNSKLWDIFQFFYSWTFFQIIFHCYFPSYFSFSKSFSMIFGFWIDRLSHFFQEETIKMLVGVFAKLVENKPITNIALSVKEIPEKIWIMYRKQFLNYH